MHNKRGGFTLIEIMVSVVIISTVVLALLELISNNAHIFSIVDKKSKSNQYISLIISNPDYGREDKKVTINDLVKEFNLEYDLRRKLKDSRVEVLYQKIQTIDTSEANEDGSDENTTDEQSGGMVFEIGKSVIKFSDSATSLFRIKIQ
jgi:prepilin-type N-terminal cleavage/methylation domain-containing protein